MAYEGVKYKTVFVDNKIPGDPRINELRNWCKVFHEKNLAPYYPGGTHGNMSFRLAPGKNSFIITAARSSFAENLSDDSFFTVLNADLNEKTLQVSGVENREPSSEAMLHFSVYKERPDVQAILHGHCETISQYSNKMGIPTTTEFVESGTMKIIESVLEVLGSHTFIEIKDHGFLAMAGSIQKAGELAMKMLKGSSKFSASD